MKKCSVAVDIGASSGRLMAGYLDENNLQLIEVHRFENKLIKKNGHYCWDIAQLFKSIKVGIHQAINQGLEPISIGIDTWAVDFVLLDKDDQLLTEAVSYRDPRTDGMMEYVFQTISKERLYLETGIQFQKFNTIYQLSSLKKTNPDTIAKAKTFLMIPDYLNFLLTGKKTNEYTNATSTQLVNAFTKKWDCDLLEQLGLPPAMFQAIQPVGTNLGSIKPELVEEFGLGFDVILPATHDTGSAVIAVPEKEKTIYISSGTWSLVGLESNFPICVTKALDYNFTNEGGIDYRFRFLKNIMGLWMIQEVKRNYNNRYTFSEFVQLANEASDFKAMVNVNHDRFLKPENMIKEIQSHCQDTGQMIPKTAGEVAKCVFNSLASSYQTAINQIEEIYEKEFEQINIIGGGCQNEMLNQLIADTSKKRVIAGPIEATAIGNLIAQLIATGDIKNIDEGREIISKSFEMKQYQAKEEKSI